MYQKTEKEMKVLCQFDLYSKKFMSGKYVICSGVSKNSINETKCDKGSIEFISKQQQVVMRKKNVMNMNSA